MADIDYGSAPLAYSQDEYERRRREQDEGGGAPNFSTPGYQSPTPAPSSSGGAPAFSSARTGLHFINPETGGPAMGHPDYVPGWAQGGTDEQKRAAGAIYQRADADDYLRSLDANYRRAAQQQGRRVDETDANVLLSALDYARTGQLAGGQPSFAPANTSPTFDDPSQRLIEDTALGRYHQRQNPDPNSGTALFEKLTRDLIEKLRGPVYSASDEAIIKTKAMDALMQDRDIAKQQWMQRMSRMGHPPTSGAVAEGLRKIDEHYETMGTQVNAQFAQDAIAQTRQQRFQVLDTAAKLANSEETRLNDALGFAMIPQQLQDQAFQRNLSLVGAAGNPAQAVQNALSLYNSVTQNNRLANQDRQNALLNIFGALGELF